MGDMGPTYITKPGISVTDLGHGAHAALQSPIPPDYVFWFHNDMLLNFQPKRDGVKVETDYGSRTHSKLEIKDANESDTGNYTCSTSSGKPYSIYVQVLAGKSLHHFSNTIYLIYLHRERELRYSR